MTDTRTIARPYARALFAHAQGTKGLSQAWEQLHVVLAAAVQDPALALALKNPNIDNALLVDLLADICEEADAAGMKKVGRDACINWLKLLNNANRLDCLPAIAEQFSAAVQESDGAMTIMLSSAHALTKEQQEALSSKLEGRWQKTITPQFHKDESLVGGVRVQAGDWVMDSSIQEKLLRLSEDIQS